MPGGLVCCQILYETLNLVRNQTLKVVEVLLGHKAAC